MRWILMNKIEYLDHYLVHYLKKIHNYISLTYKKSGDFAFFNPDRAILLTSEIDIISEKFIKECNENHVFLTIITENLNIVDHPNIYYIQEKGAYLSKLLENKTIPSKFNFTDMHQAMPQILNWIKRKKTGKFNFFNNEIHTAEEFNLFFGYEKEIIDEKIIVPYKELSLSSPLLKLEKKKINIYIPTYYRFNKTKKSIDNIKELAKKSIHDIKIYLGDNNTKSEEMKIWLRNLECNIYYSGTNVGKANIVNHLHKNARECDYIFSIDSDMYFEKREKKDYHVFDKMIEVLEKCDNIGLVSSNQYDCSQHWYGRTVRVKKNRGFNIGCTVDGTGVAGGCLVMRCIDWEKIGMYKENHDIYTGDDSILTYNVFRKLGKLAVVSHDYYMVHPAPSEDESDYTKWKGESWHRDNLNFIKDDYKGSNTKGFYD